MVEGAPCQGATCDSRWAWNSETDETETMGILGGGGFKIYF